MNPFATLSHQDARPGTKTHTLLNIIAAGRCPTSYLVVRTGWQRNLITELLSSPRKRGSVRFVEGVWEVVPDFPGADVQRAIALLESKGYKIKAPAA